MIFLNTVCCSISHLVSLTLTIPSWSLPKEIVSPESLGATVYGCTRGPIPAFRTTILSLASYGRATEPRKRSASPTQTTMERPKSVLSCGLPGQGGYRAADAFQLHGSVLMLLASVSGLAKDADPIRKLEAKLPQRAAPHTAPEAEKRRR
jgi:hypothetical protein